MRLSLAMALLGSLALASACGDSSTPGIPPVGGTGDSMAAAGDGATLDAPRVSDAPATDAFPDGQGGGEAAGGGAQVGDDAGTPADASAAPDAAAPADAPPPVLDADLGGIEAGATGDASNACGALPAGGL